MPAIVSLKADGLCAVLLASIGEGFVLCASGLVLSLKLISQGCLLIAFGAVRKCFLRMARFLVGFLHNEPPTNSVCSPFKMQPERKRLSQVLIAFVGAQRWTSVGVGTRAHLQVLICP